MKKKTKKNIKSMKGGVSLNGLFPRRQGETVIEYVDRIEGSRLPRYRTVLPMRKTIERGNTRNESHQSYLTRLRRRFTNIIRESPIKEDKPSSPDLPRVPTPPQRSSRRRRQNTRSAPSNRNTKSKRSDKKLALKGSYKRRRASAPVNKRMSSQKAKNFLYNEKRKKTLKGGG
jgi:hypothetical protein